jgi:hypothetical protein
MAQKPTRNSGRATSRTTSPVRNTAIPKSQPQRQSAPQSRRQVSQDSIAKRAYEIWISGKGGNETENWLRAERELRGS